MEEARGRGGTGRRGGWPAPGTLIYFFYGTLMDPDVLATIIGENRAFIGESAWLTGYRRVFMRGATYPGLVPAADERVEGVVVRGLDAEDERRLNRFEGDAYRSADVTVQALRSGWVRARCYLPVTTDCVDKDRPWTFADWRRRHRARYLQRIRRVPVAADAE